MLLPLLGFAVVYALWFNGRDFNSVMSMLLHDKRISPKVLTLSLLANLIPFVIFNTKRLDYAMKGVVVATMLYALLIVLIINLVRAIHAGDAHADIRCWGGDKMQGAGATLVKHYRELAFMGFVEVLMHLRTIMRNMDFCKQDIRAYKPDVLVDFYKKWQYSVTYVGHPLIEVVRHEKDVVPAVSL
eukprot:gene14464-14260_t